MAYLMAAACGVEACKEGSSNLEAVNAAKMSLSDCKRVSNVMASLSTSISYDKSDVFRLMKVRDRTTSREQRSTIQEQPLHAPFSYFSPVQEFELAILMKDPAEQMRVLGECKTMPVFKPEHFVTLGQSSFTCGDATAVPAGVSAFQTALGRIQESTPLPDGTLGHVREWA
jgi:hypothetical protein